MQCQRVIAIDDIGDHVADLRIDRAARQEARLPDETDLLEDARLRPHRP